MLVLWQKRLFLDAFVSDSQLHADINLALAQKLRSELPSMRKRRIADHHTSNFRWSSSKLIKDFGPGHPAAMRLFIPLCPFLPSSWLRFAS